MNITGVIYLGVKGTYVARSFDNPGCSTIKDIKDFIPESVTYNL